MVDIKIYDVDLVMVLGGVRSSTVHYMLSVPVATSYHRTVHWATEPL